MEVRHLDPWLYLYVSPPRETLADLTDPKLPGFIIHPILMLQVKSLVPHVFTSCGHVQGYARQLAWGPCPMCRTPGPLVEVGITVWRCTSTVLRGRGRRQKLALCMSNLLF